VNATRCLALARSLGQGVNNNAPMRVGTAPENYNTTGGYALYPGARTHPQSFILGGRDCCAAAAL